MELHEWGEASPCLCVGAEGESGHRVVSSALKATKCTFVTILSIPSSVLTQREELVKCQGVISGENFVLTHLGSFLCLSVNAASNEVMLMASAAPSCCF